MKSIIRLGARAEDQFLERAISGRSAIKTRYLTFLRKISSMGVLADLFLTYNH
jgi:hypothetical protein